MEAGATGPASAGPEGDVIDKGRTPDLTRLPAQVPDSVTLFLGQDDCFPFRIDYLRSVPKSSPRRLIGLEFFELNFSGPIDSGQFIFTPSNLDIIDRTEEFIRSLGPEGSSRDSPAGKLCLFCHASD